MLQSSVYFVISPLYYNQDIFKPQQGQVRVMCRLMLLRMLLNRVAHCAKAVLAYPDNDMAADKQRTRAAGAMRVMCRVSRRRKDTLVYTAVAGSLLFVHHFLISSSTRILTRFPFSDLLDKPWSQVSSLLPPGTCLHFYHAWGSAFPLPVEFRRIF